MERHHYKRMFCTEVHRNTENLWNICATLPNAKYASNLHGLYANSRLVYEKNTIFVTEDMFRLTVTNTSYPVFIGDVTILLMMSIILNMLEWKCCHCQFDIFRSMLEMHMIAMLASFGHLFAKVTQLCLQVVRLAWPSLHLLGHLKKMICWRVVLMVTIRLTRGLALLVLLEPLSLELEIHILYLKVHSTSTVQQPSTNCQSLAVLLQPSLIPPTVSIESDTAFY